MSPAKKKQPAKKPVRKAPLPPSKFKVIEFDPKTKIGPRTGVEQLFRVTEEQGDVTHNHLVFFDKHGWYCALHGRECPAVAQAQKVAKRK